MNELEIASLALVHLLLNKDPLAGIDVAETRIGGGDTAIRTHFDAKPASSASPKRESNRTAVSFLRIAKGSRRAHHGAHLAEITQGFVDMKVQYRIVLETHIPDIRF